MAAEVAALIRKLCPAYWDCRKKVPLWEQGTSQLLRLGKVRHQSVLQLCLCPLQAGHTWTSWGGPGPSWASHCCLQQCLPKSSSSPCQMP